MRNAFYLFAFILLGCRMEEDLTTQVTKPSFEIEFPSKAEVKFTLTNSSSDLNGYRLYRKTNSGVPELLFSLLPSETSFTDSTINATESYTYQVESFAGQVTALSEAITITYLDKPEAYQTASQFDVFDEFNVFDGVVIGKVRISVDGTMVAATRAYGSQDFALLNLVTGEVDTMKVHGNDGAFGLVFSADGHLVATGNYRNSEVKIWDVQSRTLHYTLSPNLGGVYTLQFSKDNKRLAVGGFLDNIFTYNVGDWTIHHSSETEAITRSLLFDKNDLTLLSSGNDDKVRIWDSAGSLVKTFSGHNGHVGEAIFSADEAYVLGAGYEDNKLIMWDVASSQAVNTFTAAGPINGLVLTRHNTIIIGDGSGAVSLLNQNLEFIKSFHLGSGVQNIDYHSNKDMAAVYLRDGRIVILQNESKWQAY